MKYRKDNSFRIGKLQGEKKLHCRCNSYFDAPVFWMFCLEIEFNVIYFFFPRYIDKFVTSEEWHSNAKEYALYRKVICYMHTFCYSFYYHKAFHISWLAKQVKTESLLMSFLPDCTWHPDICTFVRYAGV